MEHRTNGRTRWGSARAGWLALLMVIGGCEARAPEVGCAFGPPHLQARTDGSGFDGLDLVEHAGGAALVWSERSGLYLAQLAPNGRPGGAPRRLGTACPGGVAAATSADALFVACLRPADRDRGRDGAVVLLRVEADETRIIGELGPVGAESRGVDVAALGPRIVVGWRDADVFTARTRIAERDDEWTTRALSSEGTLASAPSLVFSDGSLVMAWTESWMDPGGQPAGHLFVQREGAPPRPSLGVAAIDVRVHLERDARGLLVTLRDRRPAGAAHRSFVGRLDARDRLTVDALRSPARADARDGAPMLVPCGDHVFSVATRTSSRGVTMVSLRRLDEALRSVEAEHQIYEYHARFPQAVGVCVGGALLVAAAERATEASPTPRLRTDTLRCGEGIAHERTPGRDEIRVESLSDRRPADRRAGGR